MTDKETKVKEKIKEVKLSEDQMETIAKKMAEYTVDYFFKNLFQAVIEISCILGLWLLGWWLSNVVFNFNLDISSPWMEIVCWLIGAGSILLPVGIIFGAYKFITKNWRKKWFVPVPQ
ncbi:hypothetical protein ACFL1Y_00270 [Patescibacteria group bacterium]